MAILLLCAYTRLGILYLFEGELPSPYEVHAPNLAWWLHLHFAIVLLKLPEDRLSALTDERIGHWRKALVAFVVDKHIGGNNDFESTTCELPTEVEVLIPDKK